MRRHTGTAAVTTVTIAVVIPVESSGRGGRGGGIGAAAAAGATRERTGCEGAVGVGRVEQSAEVFHVTTSHGFGVRDGQT